MFYGLYDSMFVYMHSYDDNMIDPIHHTNMQYVIVHSTRSMSGLSTLQTLCHSISPQLYAE